MQKYKENFTVELKNFISEVNKHKVEYDFFNPKEVVYINFDEMPLFMDMSLGRTYSFKGEREIVTKKNSGQKKRVSVISTVSSVGHKFPTILICKNFPRAYKPSYSSLIKTFKSKNSWITCEILIFWYSKIIKKFIDENKDKYEVVLIFDKCPIHLKSNFIDALVTDKVKYHIIPGGLTSLVQPLDVSLHKPLKGN